MSNIVYGGQFGTIIINGSILEHLAGGENPIELSTPNEHMNLQNGYDGDSITVSKNNNSKQIQVIVRVQRNSSSHRILNSLYNQPQFNTFDGSYKEIFVRDGTQSVSTYEFFNGQIQNAPSIVVSPADSNEVAEYTLLFGSHIASIG